ncbi:MAG: prepilin peptidase [Alphaproteobacteria bacterium]|nr:MAG: prepilin peptidase [Alphaproteobacteria bacterium]
MPRITVVGRLTVWRERPLAVGIAGATALAACVASVAAAPGLPGYLGAALALVAIAIAVIDARWFIIPNELTAAGLALALVNAASEAPLAMWEAVGVALLRGAALALLFLALREAYRRLRGRDGIGLGDVKLAGMAGAWLDWTTMPIAIEIAALSAIAVFGVRYYRGRRTVDPSVKLPFGLFLAPSIWIGWLIEVRLFAPL